MVTSVEVTSVVDSVGNMSFIVFTGMTSTEGGPVVVPFIGRSGAVMFPNVMFDITVVVAMSSRGEVVILASGKKSVELFARVSFNPSVEIKEAGVLGLNSVLSSVGKVTFTALVILSAASVEEEA